MNTALLRRLERGLVTIVGTRIPRAAARFYPDILWRVPTTSKTAYLTYDDGPHPDLTDRILEVLHRHDARATFFVLGRNARSDPGIVRRIRDQGHGIGNHSYTHPDAWRTDSEAVLSELVETDALLQEISEEPVGFVRPPYGRFTRAMIDWCRQRRQRLTMWDVGPGDYLEAMSEEDVVREVLDHVRPGSIIVLHDNPRCADDAPVVLDRILSRLSASGWTFPSLPASARS